MEKNSKIYIAGHQGMVGSAIFRQLKTNGYTNLVYRTHAALDLIDQKATADFFAQENPEYVFLAAAKVGGILANKTQKADFIYENSQIQNNVIYNSWKFGVKKLIFMGSSCVYPTTCPIPIKEEYLLGGPFEETNDAYAAAKVAGIMMCQSFNQQYKTNFLSVMPTSLYGPNDNFDLNNSHVIPALIRKFHEAKKNNIDEIILWGSGAPLREFLFVDDLADALVFLMNNYNSSQLINIGTGKSISIKELAETIGSLIDYNGKIKWDTSKPDGVFEKTLDISRISSLGWGHSTTLKDGLIQEIKYFLSFKDNIKV